MKSILTANVMRNKDAKYDERHGGPYDRGAADSWYIRPRRPHYMGKSNGKGLVEGSKEVTADKMTKSEIEAYHAGYDDNEAGCGCHKDYS